MIELIVVMAIIGLVAALVVTAVQSAREASRQTACLANLHQIGVAISAYDSAKGTLPPGRDEKAFSFHVLLLPYMENEPLALQIRAAMVRAIDPLPDSAGHVPEFFVCPSDVGAYLDRSDETVGTKYWVPATSYHGNFGTGVQKYGYNGVLVGTPQGGPIVRGQISDGLSNTAAISEALSGDGSWSELTTQWNTVVSLTEPDQLDEFAQACLDPSFRKPGNAWERGRPWVRGEASFTLYNHVLPPNRPACMNGNLVQLGAYPPSSNHRRGVNLLYADAHADFTSDSIDLAAWRAIGSRAGK